MPSRNSGRIRKMMSDDMLYAASSIVKRYRLNLRMAPKEISALIKGGWPSL